MIHPTQWHQARVISTLYICVCACVFVLDSRFYEHQCVLITETAAGSTTLSISFSLGCSLISMLPFIFFTRWLVLGLGLTPLKHLQIESPVESRSPPVFAGSVCRFKFETNIDQRKHYSEVEGHGSRT